MIRAYFLDLAVTGRTDPVQAVLPGPNRVAIRFAAPLQGGFVVSSSVGGQLVVRATGEDVELTRPSYGDLLDSAWTVLPITIDSASPDTISILISQDI